VCLNERVEERKKRVTKRKEASEQAGEQGSNH